MARVCLEIDDPSNSLTLKTILEKEGHVVGGLDPDVVVVDNPGRAMDLAAGAPTLILATASEITKAVEVMRKGVYGYIFLPLQAGEAHVMVQRAVRAWASEGAQAEPEPELLSLEEMERRHIEMVLRSCNHNQAKAARVLGIGRNTLWRKLKKNKTAG